MLSLIMRPHTFYRLAFALLLLTVLVLLWLGAGVGIIGQDGDPANRMYVAVLAVGVLGAVAMRFKARAMVGVALAMAAVQALITGVALVQGLGLPWSGPAELIILNGFFIALFAASAWLFRQAARRT